MPVPQIIRRDVVEQPNILSGVLGDACIAQTGVFVSLEFIDGIIHERAVKDAKAHEHLEVFHGQAGNSLEQSRLKLRDDVLHQLRYCWRSPNRGEIGAKCDRCLALLMRPYVDSTSSPAVSLSILAAYEHCIRPTRLSGPT